MCLAEGGKGLVQRSLACFKAVDLGAQLLVECTEEAIKLCFVGDVELGEDLRDAL